MKKHIKIILSVVIACTLLFVVTIPSFAEVIDTRLYLNNSFTYTEEGYISDRYIVESSFDNRSVYNVSGSFVSFDGENNVTINFSKLYVGTLPNGDELSGSPYTFISYEPTAAPNTILPLLLSIEGEGTAVFTSTNTLDIQGELPSNVLEFMSNFYNGIPSEYDGNPFLDIMNSIIESLDVNLFGDFSLWDMLTTICGLFAVVWLLKLLAGG